MITRVIIKPRRGVKLVKNWEREGNERL